MVTRFFVEPLPPRPSLEHQQKVAKRLLRDAWAGDPDAVARVHAFLAGKINPESMKLRDAQLVVARGYGFDSWTAMKRKIESLIQSPLEQFDVAVREGDAGRAREFLAKHADIRARINEPRFDYDSPAIHQAKKNLPLVDVLLEYAADINARSTHWAGGFGILESISPPRMLPGSLGIRRSLRLVRVSTDRSMAGTQGIRGIMHEPSSCCWRQDRRLIQQASVRPDEAKWELP